MGVAQNTGTGQYCDDTAGYRYWQKKCYRHIPNQTIPGQIKDEPVPMNTDLSRNAKSDQTESTL
jgi:hypothetical protein